MCGLFLGEHFEGRVEIAESAERAVTAVIAVPAAFDKEEVTRG